MAHIYYLENLVNKKIYIGKTYKVPPRLCYNRIMRGRLKTEKFLNEDVEKYGKENFFFFIIGEFPDEKVNEWQNYYIKKFNSYHENGFGYNMKENYNAI